MKKVHEHNLANMLPERLKLVSEATKIKFPGFDLAQKCSFALSLHEHQTVNSNILYSTKKCKVTDFSFSYIALFL